MRHMIKVSIVIPTKNAGSLFVNTLEGIKNQEYEDHIELVCIDSGSSDETISLAEQYGAIVKTIPPEEFNHGLTRNMGIEISSGEIIIIMSQDAVPGDRYLIKNFVDAFEDPQVAGAYARQVPRTDADLLTKRNLNHWLTGRETEEVRWIKNWKTYKQLTPMQRHRFYNFDDVCSALRKSVWKAIPFRANDFGEDIDWSQQVLEAGWKIAYWPKSFVVHSHDRSFMYDYKRNFQTSKKVFEQYGLCLVPSWKHIIPLVLNTIIKDWKYILQNEKNFRTLLKMVVTIPLLSFATIYGQYKGFKAAANEITAS
jgi:rhamnosyltransferase